MSHSNKTSSRGGTTSFRFFSKARKPFSIASLWLSFYFPLAKTGSHAQIFGTITSKGNETYIMKITLDAVTMMTISLKMAEYIKEDKPWNMYDLDWWKKNDRKYIGKGRDVSNWRRKSNCKHTLNTLLAIKNSLKPCSSHFL